MLEDVTGADGSDALGVAAEGDRVLEDKRSDVGDEEEGEGEEGEDALGVDALGVGAEGDDGVASLGVEGDDGEEGEEGVTAGADEEENGEEVVERVEGEDGEEGEDEVEGEEGVEGEVEEEGVDTLDAGAEGVMEDKGADVAAMTGALGFLIVGNLVLYAIGLYVVIDDTGVEREDGADALGAEAEGDLLLDKAGVIEGAAVTVELGVPLPLE